MSIESQDLLIEIGTEELPPKSLQALSNAFTAGIVSGLKEAGLVEANQTRSFASPRRLGVLVYNVQAAQKDREIERVGPPLKAATDAEGQPNKVGAGFARSVGVTFEELGQKETGRGPCLYYKSLKKGESLSQLLASIIDTSLSKLPIKRNMRWGDRREQFVRPVHWLLTMHGNKKLEVEVMGLKSDQVTRGHRFHAHEAIEVLSSQQYEDLLETKGFVIPDFSKRREKVKSAIIQAASGCGAPELDDELIDEVTALVEWPLGLLGSFDKAFLDVPQECLISSMKEHQKYFPVLDQQGSLLPHFVVVTNIDSPKPELIIQGNEKVIAPRLQDAAFFYAQDKKRGLAHFQEVLKGIVFQADLGSIYEKSERISKLASFLSKAIGARDELCKQGGLLCKADLASDMVFEFTELQGTMGRYYALAEGLDSELADAIHEHYMPRFSGDAIPSTLTGCALALADKIDTIVGLFGISKPPTGSKDPYSLRRAALGILRIAIEKKLSLSLTEIFEEAAKLHGPSLSNQNVVPEAVNFVISRFPAKYKEEGKKHDSVSAVSVLNVDSPYDFHRRVEAVDLFRSMPEAESLAQANKRVRNILKDQDTDSIGSATTIGEEDAEQSLAKALSEKEELIKPLLQNQDYTATLKSLATLKEPVDRFFDEVKVMADDQALRMSRLHILDRLRKLFLEVADISQLQ